MSRPGASTDKVQPVTPVVVVVGASAELVKRCREAVLTLGLPGRVKECDVLQATNTVARWRPVVMLMTEDVYAFDPNEFDALARDVSARILRVPDERISRARLEQLLHPPLKSFWQV